MRTRIFRFSEKLKKAQNYDFLQSEFFERTHIYPSTIVRRRYVKVRVVQVRACGRDEIVLCGKAQKPFRIRFVEGGIITFKPVKAVRHQPRDKKFQLVFRDIHGVRDNRNAAVFFDELHAVHRAESVARNVRFFAGAQVLIKGVGHRFCKPLFQQYFNLCSLFSC